MRTMRATVSAVAMVVLAGCGSDSTTAPTPTPIAANAAIVGTWTLTTVNGSSLPFLIQASDPMIEIVSDQFILSADGTFTALFSVRATNDGAVVMQSRPDAGRYSLNGTVATFTFNDQSGGSGTWSGNTLTLGGGGATWVYIRN